MTRPRTPIERELTRVLAERAADVASVPDYLSAIATGTRPRPERSPLGRRSARSWRFGPSERSGWLPACLAALLIIVVVAGIALAVPGRHRPRPAVTSHRLAPRCVAQPSASFERAVRHGLLTDGGRPLTALSLYADGAVLAATVERGATGKVVLVDPDGTIETVWSAARGQHLLAVANPVGAIDPDHAVFQLVPAAAGQAPAQLVVYDRSRRVSTAQPFPRGWTGLSRPETGPTTSDDAFTVIMRSTTSSAERLAYYTVAFAGSGPLNLSPRLLFRQRQSDVTALLPVGGNQLVLSGSGDAVRIGGPGNHIPTTLAPAVRNGVLFSSDRTTLWWLEDRGASQYLWRWRAGDPAPVHRKIVLTGRVTTLVGGLLSTGSGGLLLDSRTRRAAELPANTSVDLAAGRYATLLRTASGGPATALVPLASILPSRC